MSFQKVPHPSITLQSKPAMAQHSITHNCISGTSHWTPHWARMTSMGKLSIPLAWGPRVLQNRIIQTPIVQFVTQPRMTISHMDASSKGHNRTTTVPYGCHSVSLSLSVPMKCQGPSIIHQPCITY